MIWFSGVLFGSFFFFSASINVKDKVTCFSSFTHLGISLCEWFSLVVYGHTEAWPSYSVWDTLAIFFFLTWLEFLGNVWFPKEHRGSLKSPTA